MEFIFIYGGDKYINKINELCDTLKSTNVMEKIDQRQEECMYVCGVMVVVGMEKRGFHIRWSGEA